MGERRYTWFTIRYLSLYWGWYAPDNIYKTTYLQVLVLIVLQVSVITSDAEKMVTVLNQIVGNGGTHGSL